MVSLALIVEADNSGTRSSLEEKSVALAVATPTTFEVSPNQTETIDLAAEAQQYVLFSIDKGDVYLAFSVQDPDGRTIVEGNSYKYEPIEASFVSGPAGVYRLIVHSLERAPDKRWINVQLDTLHAATAVDIADASAFQAFATAGRLRTQWTSSSLRAAIDKYKEASANWRSHGNWSRAAYALAEAGEIFFILGEYRHALDHHKQAVEASQRARDPRQESLYLSNAAQLHSILGASDQAQRSAERILSYYSRNNSASLPETMKHSYGVVLGHLGEVHYATGNLVRATDDLERSEQLLDEVGDRSGAARTRLFLGYTSATTGDRERALTKFNQALTAFREVNNRAGEALALTAIGIGCSLRRDDETAIKFHREARGIFQSIGDHQSEAITLNGIAQAYQNLHEYDLALKHYQEALRQFQENGSIDFATVGLCQIGTVYNLKGDTAQALAYYEQCARASRAANKTRILSYAMDDIAAIYARTGGRTEALAQYNKLLTFYSKINDRRGEALTLNNLGDLYLASGNKSKALEFYGRAVPLSKQAGESGIEISTLYSLAKGEQAAGMLDAALTHIKESISIIEGLRSNLASPNLRSAYFSGLRQHYDLYIDLLMRLDQEQPGKGYGAAALLASETARARSLREMLAEMGTDIRQGLDPATLKRERELQYQLSAQAQNQTALSGKDVANESDLDLLRAEYEELQAKIRHHNPRYENLLQPAPLTIQEIQSLLDPHTLLLEYSLGAEQSYLWAVTNNSLDGYRLPSKTTVEPAALEFYNLITARQHGVDQGYQARVEAADKQLHENSRKLTNTLLGPVAHLLGDKRLLIVTEGALQYVPFDALPIPTTENAATNQEQPLLISRHEIVSLPSVSILAAIRNERRPRNTSSKLVAVFADPVFTASDDRARSNNGTDQRQTMMAQYSPSPNDPSVLFPLQSRSGLNRLAHTAEEAAAIRRAASADAWVAEGFEATRESALGEQLQTYKIIHFATHGLINAEHPELSGVVLSMLKPDGSSQNGFLQLHDIYRLRLTADLTVLSACNTALGKDVRGEGLIGLTRGFMYAGSRGVVASLWEVDDRATAVVMENFYSAMLRDGLTPAAALRSAKEAVRKQPAWSHPYFWAGFVLQGEYSEPIEARSRATLLPAVLTAIALVTVLVLLLLEFRNRLRSSCQKYGQKN